MLTKVKNSAIRTGYDANALPLIFLHSNFTIQKRKKRRENFTIFNRCYRLRVNNKSFKEGVTLIVLY